MPATRKEKSRVPLRSHHPSQSSVDVPAVVKNQVKDSQGRKCWLCNQKARKSRRPLEICHIFPQANSKRYNFIMHHKSGRIQLDNIHDIANLVALCSICHFAFDLKEWTFLPEDMVTWVQDAEAEPERDFVQEINSRRTIKFRRWRLENDPDSEASRDDHFISAFTNVPIKIWPGEVGAVILSNIAILATPETEADKDLIEAIEEYDKLRKIWLHYKRPCSKQECSICSPKRDDKELDEEEDDDDSERDKGGRYNQKKRRVSPRERLDSAQNLSKTFPKSHRYETRQSSALTANPSNCSIRATIRGYSRVSMPRHIVQKENGSSYHKKSALYDKSVPYSHREGYTFARTTANELMAIWQAYRTETTSGE
jgi:hypothetical protein